MTEPWLLMVASIALTAVMCFFIGCFWIATLMLESWICR